MRSRQVPEMDSREDRWWGRLALRGGIAVVVGIALLVIVRLIAASGDGRSNATSLLLPHGTTATVPPTGRATSSCTVSVTAYGASTSAADNAAAFQSAIVAGEGGIVCIPPGTWRVTSQLIVPVAETLTGAGAASTTLLQTVTDHNLLQVRGNGTVVEDLTLDTQTYDGGIAFSTGASHVTLRNAQVRSGNQPGHFAIYFAGPRGATVTAPHYSTGNTLENVVVSDQICDDGVSWSFQTGGTIDNVHETGSRLALYVDNGTTVDGYQYTPGPCTAQDDGFWITPPSQAITIDGFVSSGAAGKICPNISKGSSCTNITVEAEQAPRGTLQIGDVTGLNVLGATVQRVLVTTATGAMGNWVSSTPVTAQCSGRPVAIVGLSC
ncbi:MAG: glycosyl hydrolase family 28-related protein [Acidimicrobiales bacterium]